MIRTQHKMLYLALGLTLLACLGLWLPVPFIARLVAVTLLTAFLPGYWLLDVTRRSAEDRLEQVTLAIGLSYGLTILATLGLLYTAGHLSSPLVGRAMGLVTLSLGLVSFGRSNFGLIRLAPVRFFGDKSPTTEKMSPLPPDLAVDVRPLPRLDILYWLIPTTIAAFFSFTNLGYADYWGDEMNGLLRAIAIIGGQKEAVFEHTKGPVEVLLPAVYGLLTGRFEPFTLRFPFALAYVAALGSYTLLARRLFGRYIGLIAALILAINGLHLAFARMVQYQSVVLLMTALALLLAYRFYQNGQAKYLLLSLFLVGVGLLAHYDMLLVLPPLGYLIWRRYGWRWSAWRANWPYLLGAGLILLVVTAVFYLPFLLNSHLSGTSSYLSRRILGDSNWPASNFDELYQFAVMHNSSYYVLFIAVLGSSVLAAHLLKTARRCYRDRWFWGLLGVALLLTGLSVLLGRVSFAPLLLSILIMSLLLISPTLSTELKVIYLWFGISFIGYVFLVDHPRTHLRIIYPGWSLLVALAIIYLLPRLPRYLTVGVIITLCLLYGVFVYYQYLLFVDSDQEYIFTYPKHKAVWYWEDPAFPFGSRRMYGVPHRLGWQMINQLYTQGYFQGDWDSNDDGSNLFWYTLGAPRNPCYPRYYFFAHFDQHEGDWVETANFDQTFYAPIGQVWNRDRLQIEVYEFAPLGRQGNISIWSEPAHYVSFVTPGDFQSQSDLEVVPQITHPISPPVWFKPHPVVLQQIADHYGDPRIVQVKDTAALLGYDLDTTWAKPGGVVTLTLYWQAVEPINLPYKIFTHLESKSTSSQLWAQADDLPACGTVPTQRWPVNQLITDRHLLRLPPDLPQGDYNIQVGLYEPETGLRMDLLDEMKNPAGNVLSLVSLSLPN